MFVTQYASITESKSESPPLVSTNKEKTEMILLFFLKDLLKPRLRNSFALDFFIVINLLSVRFDPLSFEFIDVSFTPIFPVWIGEPVPIVNGEFGRRQPLDQCGFLIGGFGETFSVLIGADFVPVNDEAD